MNENPKDFMAYGKERLRQGKMEENFLFSTQTFGLDIGEIATGFASFRKTFAMTAWTRNDYPKRRMTYPRTTREPIQRLRANG